MVVPGFDRLGYMPGAQRLVLKLLAEIKTQKVIGAQVVGTGGVDKRVDALAAAMSFGATLEDLSNIDFAYAPPFNGPIDNIATAANVLMNKIEGRLRSINPKDFKELRKSGEYTLVDVRTPGEYKVTVSLAVLISSIYLWARCAVKPRMCWLIKTLNLFVPVRSICVVMKLKLCCGP